MKTLSDFLAQHGMRDIDIAFAGFISRQQGASQLEVLLAAALSNALGDGHSCLYLNQLPSWLQAYLNHKQLNLAELLPDCQLIAKSEEYLPMVVDGECLYLHKYWRFERGVAKKLIQLANSNTLLQADAVKQTLSSLFPQSDQQVDWQKVAVAMAMQQQLAIITGGPGTGKTTTVTKLLAAITLLDNETSIIKIVAPTGKAAARLAESIKQNVNRLDVAEDVKKQIPSEAQTIHRLLGSKANGKFVHDANNPLHVDILVVDEASMIDLPLMYRLLDALPEQAKLILLGDKDQLASVETGTLLGDLCKDVNLTTTDIGFGWSESRCNELSSLTEQSINLMPVTHYSERQQRLIESTVGLSRSYRFAGDSGIGKLAKAINQSHVSGVLEHLSHGDIDYLNGNETARLIDICASQYSEYLKRFQQGESYFSVLNAFFNFALLCSTKEGDVGVKSLNLAIENKLKSLGLINHMQRFYAGRPVMITENDYSVNLFNGDIGIILPDENGHLMAWFLTETDEPRAVLPARLPSHETVFAMTIHKSQGSEFNTVACALPWQGGLSAHITKELIYTAVTRAKKRFVLLADKQVLLEGVTRKVKRSSGIFQQLGYC